MTLCYFILSHCSLHAVALGFTNLTANQTGPTIIDVSWTPPTPLGDTTGYIIYYTNDDNTDSVVIDGGSTDEYTLSDLQNGDTYTISIVASSTSDNVTVDIGLGESVLKQRIFTCFYL